MFNRKGLETLFFLLTLKKANLDWQFCLSEFAFFLYYFQPMKAILVARAANA